MSSERLELEEGAIVAERYRLERALARGSMGEVWLARHLGLDVPCALKFIDFGVGEEVELRQRFEREARAAAQLKSPHVVSIFDHGLHGATPYIAMEYLEGEDLAARLERQGRLSPADTRRIVSHVARALTKAHAAGIVHRDLKPANVFLVRDDDEGELAKVLDFGIAKRAASDEDERRTRFGTLVGTPAYMSPEQARGAADVDHRSDLFALAVIAFECLTGRSPFDRPALADVFVALVADPPPVPSEVSPLAGPAFDAWWARGAAREPVDRFQSAKELADALAEVVEARASVETGRHEASTTRVADSAHPESLGPIAIDETPSAVRARATAPHEPCKRAWSRRSVVALALAASALGIGAAAAFVARLEPVRGDEPTFGARGAAGTASVASPIAPLAAPTSAGARTADEPSPSASVPPPQAVAPRRTVAPEPIPAHRKPARAKEPGKPATKPRAPSKGSPRSR